MVDQNVGNIQYFKTVHGQWRVAADGGMASLRGANKLDLVDGLLAAFCVESSFGAVSPDRTSHIDLDRAGEVSPTSFPVLASFIFRKPLVP